MDIRSISYKDINATLHILNETTLDLHKKGIQQWSYPWKSSYLEHSVDQGYIYGVFDNMQLIATFIIKDVTSLHYTSIETPAKELCQIAVHPEYQAKNVGASITDYAQSLVCKFNQSLYLDCWAGNEKLKSFYTLNGFNYLGDFPEEDYIISAFKYN